MKNLKKILISIFQLFKNYVVERNIIYKYKNEDVKMKDQRKRGGRVQQNPNYL